MNPLFSGSYSPHYFLAALGAGGLSVSFFMYLMFMLPHTNTPMATFNDWIPVFSAELSLTTFMVTGSLIMIVGLAAIHIRLLVANLRSFWQFKQTKSYTNLLESNEEIGLMTIPLTLAMSVNVSFVLGALFIPDLWQVVEYLFPLAMLAFTLIGLTALRILLRYFTLAFTGKPLDFTANNSLSPMISMFAFAMIAVGLAAPAAMSQNTITVAISIGLSLFFFTVALLLTVIKLINGFQSMMLNGINPLASPSLWILIPILTLLGITWIRLSHGLHHEFNQPLVQGGLFMTMLMILSLQLLFGLLGYAVMKKIGYFEQYLHGTDKSPASFALICPGVAFFVFGMFFIHVSLVHTHLIDIFSLAYFAWLAPLILVQLLTLKTFIRLKRKMLSVANS